MEGLVLITYPSGDKDLIARVLTPEAGKLSVFARRNRSNRKQSGTLIEALDRGLFDFGDKRGDLYTLRGFRPLSSHPELRLSLSKLSIAAFLMEAIDALLPEETGAEEALYALITTQLSTLSQCMDDSTSLRICFLTLSSLLHLSGYAEPNLYETPSLHNLRKLTAVLEACTERQLRSKQALEETLTYFAKQRSKSA